jgi:hypothetical protein
VRDQTCIADDVLAYPAPNISVMGEIREHMQTL